MKTILKSAWNNKRVRVSISKCYLPGGFYRSFNMCIKVEDTSLLPSRFVKGTTHKANQDIIETMGGLPRYIASILNEAAKREYQRRANPIKEQLRLF